MRNNEQGRSMIEMLGVLAIVGVLSVGGIAGYSKAMNKFKTNKAIDQVNMISTNIRTLFSSQRNYTGLNNKLAVKANLIPTEMYDTTQASPSAITNAFGGEVDVHAAATSSDTTGAYVIYFAGVPATSCISFVTTDWGGDTGSGLMAVAAGASVAKTTLDASSLTAGDNLHVPGHTSYGIPYTIAQANSVCGGAGNKAIAWKYF